MNSLSPPVSFDDPGIIEAARTHFCNGEWDRAIAVCIQAEVELPQDQQSRIFEIFTRAWEQRAKALTATSAQTSKRPLINVEDRNAPTKRARLQSRWSTPGSGFDYFFPRILEYLSLQGAGSAFQVCRLWKMFQYAYWKRLAKKNIPKQMLQIFAANNPRIPNPNYQKKLASQNISIPEEISPLKFRPEVLHQIFLDQQFMIFAGKVAEQLPSVSFGTAAEARAWMANPANQRALQSITELSFRGGNLQILPPEIGQLVALERLVVKDNQLLTSLPPEIGQLVALKELIVKGNQLTSLPPEIGQLVALKELIVEGNQLLTSLPPEIGQLVALSTLHASNNQLTSLPPEIGQLVALVELAVRNNELTSLPLEIGRLAALKELDVSGNNLRSLPPEIGQLVALEALHAANNLLTSLPPEIGQLAALLGLNVSSNQLTSLSPKIGQVATLKVLRVSYNQLTRLPPELGQLALNMLDIDGNQLTSLPKELRRLPHWCKIITSNNPLQLDRLVSEYFE